MRFKHIFYDDTKLLKNLMRSLKTYNKRAYKQLIFKERFEELNFVNYKDNLYTAELLTDELFKKVYGVCKVVVLIRNEQAKVIGIEPQELFEAGFMRILDTYKGVPYRNEQDLFKIKIVGGIKNGKKGKNKKNIHRYN
jgi:hypothetical protein